VANTCKPVFYVGTSCSNLLFYLAFLLHFEKVKTRDTIHQNQFSFLILYRPHLCSRLNLDYYTVATPALLQGWAFVVCEIKQWKSTAPNSRLWKVPVSSHCTFSSRDNAVKWSSLNFFPPSLSFKLMFKEAHLYLISGNGGNGNSPTLLFLMVLGLGRCGAFLGRGQVVLCLLLGHPKRFSEAWFWPYWTQQKALLDQNGRKIMSVAFTEHSVQWFLLDGKLKRCKSYVQVTSDPDSLKYNSGLSTMTPCMMDAASGQSGISSQV